MLVAKTWSSDIWKETWIEGRRVQPTKVFKKEHAWRLQKSTDRSKLTITKKQRGGGNVTGVGRNMGELDLNSERQKEKSCSTWEGVGFRVELGAETRQGFKQRAVWYSHVHSRAISVIAAWKASWLWGAENRESSELERSRMKTRGWKDKVGYWANPSKDSQHEFLSSWLWNVRKRADSGRTWMCWVWVAQRMQENYIWVRNPGFRVKLG